MLKKFLIGATMLFVGYLFLKPATSNKTTTIAAETMAQQILDKRFSPYTVEYKNINTKMIYDSSFITSGQCISNGTAYTFGIHLQCKNPGTGADQWDIIQQSVTEK